MAAQKTIANLWRDAMAEQRQAPAYLHEVDGEWREVSWAEAGVAVDERGDGRFADNAGHGGGVELLEAERFLVEHQHRDAVRVDAGEIGVGHDVGGGADDVVGHSPGAQDFADLAVDRFSRVSHRADKLLPRHRVRVS